MGLIFILNGVVGLLGLKQKVQQPLHRSGDVGH
ncbi:DUF2754 family protein [Shigella flexneri]